MQISSAPANFKVEIPYYRTNDGIMLVTYWGAQKMEQLVLLDNHAPTWASNVVIKGNQSVHQSNNIEYKTTTGDGTAIQGAVYVCDSIFLGNIPFKQVMFYKIAEEENLVKHKSSAGALGDNVMATGIWKIDFKNRKLTIASNLDSIKDVTKADKIPVHFNDNIISIETQLSNNTKKLFELDLGFNLTVMMAEKDFAAIYKSNSKSSALLSTPAGDLLVNMSKTPETIKIGKKDYQTMVITHSSGKENLIGLAFFEQFDFIILDYLNKAFYVKRNDK